MKRKRSLWVILFGIPALLILPLAVVGSRVYTSGSIDVEVVERNGSSVGIHVPATLVTTALHFIPECTVDGVRVEMDPEARQALRIAAAVAEELEDCPDGILVDVQDAQEVVTIEKKDGKIHVFVDSPDETVRCSVPIRTVRRAVERIASI
jgi:hypothetical protein